MPPKKKSRVEHVDGVHCSLNIASGIVIVGSGIVSNDKRDSFKLKADSPLEDQVRARPKFKELVAAAAAALQPPAEMQPPEPPAPEPQPESEPEALPPPAAADPQPPLSPKRFCWRHSKLAWAKRQLKRRPAPLPLSESVLFGGARRAPSTSQRGGPRALAPRLLENDLGRAWGPGRKDGAQAQLERLWAERAEAQASRAAEAAANRKRNREAREAGQVCQGCAPGLLQEYRELTESYRELASEALNAHGNVSGKFSGVVKILADPDKLAAMLKILSERAGKPCPCSGDCRC